KRYRLAGQRPGGLHVRQAGADPELRRRSGETGTDRNVAPHGVTLGLTVTAERINGALAGTQETVDAAALNLLTGGGQSTADSEHRHLQILQDDDAEVYFRLFN